MALIFPEEAPATRDQWVSEFVSPNMIRLKELYIEWCVGQANKVSLEDVRKNMEKGEKEYGPDWEFFGTDVAAEMKDESVDGFIYFCWHLCQLKYSPRNEET